jgi:hypothetical protein
MNSPWISFSLGDYVAKDFPTFGLRSPDGKVAALFYSETVAHEVAAELNELARIRADAKKGQS